MPASDYVVISLLLAVLGVQASPIPGIPKFGPEPVAQTPLGTIRGLATKFNGVNVHTYLGVPFAKPPMGERRFHPPEPVDPWSGELSATSPARTCFYAIDKFFPQFPGADMWNPQNPMGEDCLQLNMWVPENHDGTVMVWIFGGGFFSGSPSLDLYDGSALSTMEKTIVVNINYRLGAFGFLYFGEESGITGNLGLLDQQMALLWINQNIKAFGGDPDKVTLFGESAGGASCTAHLFAPKSENLFRRIIINSGVIMNNWATKPKKTMYQMSVALAQRLNCTPSEAAKDVLGLPILGKSELSAAIDCMSKVSPDDLQTNADFVTENRTSAMAFAFVPVDDDPLFFQGNLFERYRTLQYKMDVDMLIGTVRDEGTYWLPYYLSDTGFAFNHTISAEDPHNDAFIGRTEYEKSFDKFLPYFDHSQLVMHALMDVYQNISEVVNTDQGYRDGVGRFVGDFFFTCTVADFADVLADHIHGRVYMYYFTRRSTANPWPKWMGTMHGYEIEYIYGLPFRHPDGYQDLSMEQGFAQKIMNYWKNFASTGTPIGHWPNYDRIAKKTFVLDEKIVPSDKGTIISGDNAVYVEQCGLLREATSYPSNDCPPWHEGLHPTATSASRLVKNSASITVSSMMMTVTVVVGALISREFWYFSFNQ